MNFSLTKLFKRKTAPAPASPEAPRPTPAVAEKPSADRFSKTVMPNSTRTVSAHDSLAGVSHLSDLANNGSPGLRPARSAPFPVTPVSDLPPAIALALEPTVERAIPFRLSDALQNVPPGFARALDASDADRHVLLKAADLEKGMANGRPTVSIAALYQQVPEIFVRPITPADDVQVALPFTIVLERLTSLQLRADQHREQTVPQVETPFLKVTLEDDTKFGTNIGPVETHSLPPVRLQPATAQTIAAAEPEPAAKEKIDPPTPSAAPRNRRASNGSANGQSGSNGNGNGASAAPVSTAAETPEPPTKITPPATEKPAAPTRIPFTLSPNGTDVPAPERVPASKGGASVPTSLNAAAMPTRIPFRLDGTGDAARPVADPWLTKDDLEGADAIPSASSSPSFPLAPAPTKAETMISLPLKPILQALPPFQLAGDISGVSAEAKIEVPFSCVEPQLVTGRVSLTPEQFAASLPAEYQGLFSAKEIAAPVALVLQDVLSNLPTTSLRMREDQEEQERGANFITPFSSTADEDAKRFGVPVAPSAKQTVAARLTSPEPKPTQPATDQRRDALPQAEASPAEVPAAAAAKLTPAAPVSVLAAVPAKLAAPRKRTALQEIFATDDELDPKAVVTRLNQMPGVKACAFMFADGLNLAGEMPESYEADGLCAMGPSLLQRIDNHMVETKLGALRAMTLTCSAASISFFMHDNLCLAALHEGEQLALEVRERLDRVTKELSAKYSHHA